MGQRWRLLLTRSVTTRPLSAYRWTPILRPQPAAADAGPPGGVTLGHGRGARATGRLAVARRLPDLPPGARMLRVPGRVGVLHPPGLPEPASPAAQRRHVTTGAPELTVRRDTSLIKT